MMKISKPSKFIFFVIFILISYISSESISLQSKQDSLEMGESLKPAIFGSDDLILDENQSENDSTFLILNHESIAEEKIQKSDNLVQIERLESASNISFLPKNSGGLDAWILFYILAALMIVALWNMITMKIKLNNVQEEHQNLVERYEEFRRYFIDRERKLKRELIDAYDKLEEIQKVKDEQLQ